MNPRLLLCLSLCLSLLGCKEDEPVPPTELKVSMSGSSKKLEEGGKVLEVTIALNRKAEQPYSFYLDYGDANGEYDTFFEAKTRAQGTTVKVKDQNVSVLPINFVAGEQQKIIKLKAEENEWYRGERPIELKLLSLEKDKPVYHAALNIAFGENESKPVLGILRSWEADTIRTINKGAGGNFALTLVSSVPFQFPQKINFAYTGTAVQGTHFQKVGQVMFGGNVTTKYPVSHPAVVQILASGNFDPEKTIRIKISSAGEGKVADNEKFTDSQGETFTLGDSYTLVVKN
jgi:hypothetical protein